MLLAGALKLADLPDFAASLASWDVLPKAARVPVLVGLPAMEVGIGLAWFLWFGKPVRRFLWAAALVVLTLSTGAAGAQLIWSKPPDCDCVGVIAAFRAVQRDAHAALTRNGVLMGALLAGAAIGAIGRTGAKTGAPPAIPRAAPSKHHATGGFTLIETIMVLAVIGLLLALTVPQLGMVREAAERAASRSNLRNHVQIFTMYTGDHAGEFPFFMHPDAPETIIRGGGLAYRMSLKSFFFASSVYWPVALASYYGDVAFDESTFVPGAQAQGAGFPSYLYSNSFVATPDYWRRETRLTGTSQYRPVRQNQVRFPANKGLILDPVSYGIVADHVYWPPRADAPVLVGVVDGSARSVARDALAPIYLPGPPEDEEFPWPIVHTVGGVDAADVP